MSDDRQTPRTVRYDLLHARAQERLRARLLPWDEPLNLYAGPGTGMSCALCDTAILEKTVEYEVEFAGGELRRFHIECHGVWDFERSRSVP
jgi:hypothetical protein